jgi:UDP-N-acetylmuramate dehydrogenase
MKIRENISLRAHNTFGIDKKASLFFEAHRPEDVLEAIRQANLLGKPLFVLGGGSNVLLVEDLDALVLKICIEGIEQIEEDADSVLLKVGAGVIWQDLVVTSLQLGLSGLENLSLIPGTVGAAPMQNIGAYGVELQSVFDHLEAIEIATKQSLTVDKATCAFGYRDSIFKNEWKGRYVITRVAFRLSKKQRPVTSYGDIERTLAEMGASNPSPENISKAVIKIRQQKLPDPKILGNAGSFFKNPSIPQAQFSLLKERYPKIPGFPSGPLVKVPAAWLIEQAGWKGKRFGRVGVHENQPLVLVNYGEAEGSEIVALSKKIQTDIREKFGISLEREVNLVGRDDVARP